MIPDIFFCSAPQSPERYARAREVLDKWLATGMSITILQAEPGEAYQFQSLRRQVAEHEARTPIYIVTDDDIEPSRMDNWLAWVLHGRRYMENYPNFGILSPLLEDTRLEPATVDGSPPFVDDYIQEEHNTGGIRFCRKGIITEWPEQKRRGYDEEHCAAYQRHGLKVGYMRQLWAYHPGYKSETWKPVTDYVAPKLTT